MSLWRSQHSPAGHSYVAAIGPRTKADDECEQNEAQLTRILAVNAIAIRVTKCQPVAKRVWLESGTGQFHRAARILTRNGWTVRRAET